MHRSRRKVALVTGAVVALALLGVAGWWFFIRDDAPPEADIDTAGATLDEAAEGGAGADGGVDGGGLEGTWTVDQSVGSFDDFTSTWAGYRFEEELAGVGGNTAVGRTPDVTGSLSVAGDQVTAVDVQVDLTTLESDSDRRDGALRSRGLESDQFPTATFRLTAPITLPDGFAAGERVAVSAQGELTIHGVTQDATIELQAELHGDAAVVVGRAPVALADYDIDPPTGFSVLSIADEGTFDLQLFLTKA